MFTNVPTDNTPTRIDYANHVTVPVESAKDQLQSIVLLALQPSTTTRDNVSQYAHKASTKITDTVVNA